MKQIRLAIVDEDAGYLEKLVIAFEQYTDFDVSSFYSRESVERSLEEKRYDILLCAPGIFPVNTGKGTVQIILVDDRESLPAGLGELPHISKYQRCDKIQRAILEIYAAYRPQDLDTKRSSVFLVYSPIGGSGKTTIALGLAARLAAKGKNILYQNFEEYSSCGFYLPEHEGSKGISDLLIALDENVHFGMMMQSMVQNKNERLHYFNSFRTPNDYHALTEKDIVALFESMRDAGEFDCVIVDMGSDLTPRNSALFELADKIFIVANPGKSASDKLRRFYAQKHLMNLYGDKMVQINNYDLGMEIVTGSCPVIGRIPAYENPDDVRLVDAIASDDKMRFLGQVL